MELSIVLEELVIPMFIYFILDSIKDIKRAKKIGNTYLRKIARANIIIQSSILFINLFMWVDDIGIVSWRSLILS